MMDEDDCWNCGGEGYIADCFDGFCVNAEDGCELCMRRCEYCNPAIADTHAKRGDVKQAPSLMSGGGAEGNRTEAISLYSLKDVG